MAPTRPACCQELEVCSSFLGQHSILEVQGDPRARFNRPGGRVGGSSAPRRSCAIWPPTVLDRQASAFRSRVERFHDSWHLCLLDLFLGMFSTFLKFFHFFNTESISQWKMLRFFMVVPVLQWIQFKVSGSVRCFIVYTLKTQGLSGASLTTFSGLRVGPVFHWLDFRDSGPLRCFGSCTSLWCFTGYFKDSGGSLLTLSGIVPVFTGYSLRTQGLGTPPNLPEPY